MTTASIPIYRNNDMYAPAFKVRVRQQDVPQAVLRDVISVSYKDSLEEFDSCDIVLNNWDDARTGPTQFTYCVDAQAQYADLFSFDRNRSIEVLLGYQNVSVVPVIDGTVESIEPSYPAGGAPSLRVRIVNRLKSLKDKQRTKAWVDKSTEDVAREIARDAGLTIVVKKRQPDDDQAQPYVFQDNQHDVVFLLQRARRIGYDVWLDGASTLHFEPGAAGAGTIYALGFHRSLIDFSPRLSMTDQVGTVIVSARDQVSKATFTSQATRSEIGLNRDLDSFVTNEVQKKTKTVTNQPLHANGQAKQLAREIMRDLMQKMLTADVTAPGLPDIRAGRMVQITDVGSRFSGPYFVTASTHTVDDGGYRTAFTARRESYS